MAEEYLTVKQVAAAMVVDKQTVYRLLWSGRLPRVNISLGTGRPSWRVRRAALERYMDSRERAA